ncbi:MAG TPA: hypothetical protein PLP88_04390 [Bacteroidales bacterium]|nr:hypothetical protein [Bacteroidales bacterium]
MKNRILALFVLFSFYLLLSLSCSHPNQPIPANVTLLENGRIGFIMPEGSKKVPDLMEVIKDISPNTLYLSKLDSLSSNSPLFSVRKYVNDTATPMEIAFVESVIGYSFQAENQESELTDFGVYDENGRRYRYTVKRIGMENLSSSMAKYYPESDGDTNSLYPYPERYKIMYYFMKNDMDTALYELSVVTNLEQFEKADSLLTAISKSFQFYEHK